MRAAARVKWRFLRSAVAVSLRNEFKYFRYKNGRFSRKTYHFLVIARPHRGRGNLKAKGMASRNEVREHETKN